MSEVLFINMAGHGHVNPTIGLVKELIDHGEILHILWANNLEIK
jgi:UDP:flavonoid glycosyltransferase YjiC (YdhE family)